METVIADYAAIADTELLRSMALGEGKALDALYGRYVSACNSLALRIVADPHVAEDVVQDIFLKLWATPLSYAPGRGDFSSWLLTLVRNRSIDHLRQQKRVIPTVYAASRLSAVEEMSTFAPYEMARNQEKRRALHEALSLLSAPRREAISLAYYGGLTQREIAQRLGVPLGTIKTRTQRALLQLRTLLAGEDLMEGAA